MNPFSVSSPEQISAEHIADYFVDLFTDAPKLLDPANTFIHGARGTGKSMLLRSLEPEVMLRLGRAKTIAELPYFSVHVPIRPVEFLTPEIAKLEGFGKFAIGEHLLSMHAAFRMFRLLLTLVNHIDVANAEELAKLFRNLAEADGAEGAHWAENPVGDGSAGWLRAVCACCDVELRRIRQYYTRLPFAQEKAVYEGALTGFLDFVVPLAEKVRTLPNFPDVPMFLMLDDADNLPQHLQRVVNSWVSARATHSVCLKITTQLGYATYRTVDSRVIESPHDFTDIDLSSIYTAKGATYSQRITEIARKRLLKHGLDCTPEDFFPADRQQEARLEQIRTELRQAIAGRAEGEGGSARVRDEVARTAVPTLMRELAGGSRSSHTFSYSGLASLIDLSSGVIRWFLEPAGRMFDEVKSNGPEVATIPSVVQDKVLARWSTDFLVSLDQASRGAEDAQAASAIDLPIEHSLHAMGPEAEPYQKLKNLLDGLGRLFRSRLLDAEASEQRVFSVVINGTASKPLQAILDLGVRRGYLQRSDYAAKEAFGGRLPRYILARRLGPHYKLDVSGYAAHLFVLPEKLELTLNDPGALAGSRRRFDGGDVRQTRLTLEQHDE